MRDANFTNKSLLIYYSGQQTFFGWQARMTQLRSMEDQHQELSPTIASTCHLATAQVKPLCCQSSLSSASWIQWFCKLYLACRMEAANPWPMTYQLKEMDSTIVDEPCAIIPFK